MRSLARRLSITCLLVSLSFSGVAQKWYQPADSLNERRAVMIASAQSIVYVGSLSGLQLAWYSDFDNEPFHFFNDWKGWLQMDKFGHATSMYQMSRNAYEINKWAGIADRNAMWLAAGASYSFLALVEVMDGYSTGWGFSNYDLAFNTIGVAGFVGQQLGWNEQRIKLKFSFYPSGLTNANDEIVASRAKSLFGKQLYEQWLKDYNGQTYWVSANIWSLIGKPDRFPKWLNVSCGYSVNNVLGAESNTWNIKETEFNPEYYTSTLQRQRQFLLSLDLDLEHMNLPASLSWLKPVFGFVKFPFPALEWNSKRGIVGHWMYF